MKSAKLKSPFIFAICNQYGEQTVFINTKQRWKENKCLTDSYSEEETNLLEPILDKLHLCNDMESTYSFPEDYCISNDSLHNALLKAGLDFDPKFQKWMEKEVNQ